jgi:conjugative relaxase-like TrwC/TraI family protein
MSMHKLTAGSGYDYLTRQVAALDSTEKGRTGLAAYYAQRGEKPGVWIGSGMAGIDGLNAGDPVTAEQMRALFGSGLHPLAELRLQQLDGSELTESDYLAVTRLGTPFKILDSDVSAFRVEVAKRITAINEVAGLPGDWPVPAGERARVRTEVAREFFAAEHGREPMDARELAGQVAKDSRPRTQTVAGYDLTFSPVKSVSTLWAVADPTVAAVIEQAHQAAVQDALRFIEEHALFTRTGPQGIRQVNVRGLVAAAFTHRDSRAGDPDLHTHVAVANKVQTLDGRWLSIDGRMLFKAKVAASETYNTALEQHLRGTLGVRFAERPDSDSTKRSVREIVGVDPRLNQRWSTRRAHVNVRRGELAVRFQRDHGRPPTAVEALHLAQQATLETRETKHQPRSTAEQRATWRAEAEEVLGGREAVNAMVRSAISPRSATEVTVDAAWVAHTADRVLAAVEERRSTWQLWHVRAEAQRQVRTTDIPAHRSEALVDLLVDEVLHTRSIPLAPPDDGIQEPDILRRVDGTSVYTVAGASLYTSRRILEAEQRLMAAAGRRDGAAVDKAAVDLAVLEMTANGTALDAGQAALVRQMCTSGARLQLAIAPAGAGKTTAMRALTLGWTQDGGEVIGLAPSAAAAAVLRAQTGIPSDTLAKLTWILQRGELPDWARRICRSTLVIIDEAGMADTLTLDRVVQFVMGRGGSVRLIGDDQQLGAIGAGGILRDLKHAHGALQLTELHRFTDLAEAAASLALRDGDPASLDFYLDHDRVHVGDQATTTMDAFTAWAADRTAGRDAIMLGPTRELVADLNHRARTHRLGGALTGREVQLADGNQASVGDVIITRNNDRRLSLSATDWVKNGDRWTITHLGHNGDLTVRHIRSHLTASLPAQYVQQFVELVAGCSWIRDHHSRCPGRNRGHNAWTPYRAGIPTAAVHHAQPRTDRQPPLPAGRRRRRPAHRHPTGSDRPPHAGRTAPTNPGPRRHPHLSQHPAAPAQRPGGPAPAGGPALHRRPATRCRTDPRTTTGGCARPPSRPGSAGVTDEPAWPTLRADLIALAAATGEHPLIHLHQAALGRDLSNAGDVAAVLDWRLPEPAPSQRRPPLPWLRGIPRRSRITPTGVTTWSNDPS